MGVSCIAHRTPSHHVPSQRSQAATPPTLEKRAPKGKQRETPGQGKPNMTGGQQATSEGQLTSQAHNRVGKNRQHLCMARVGGGWASGWALLDVHGSQRGWPARSVDQRHAESQKAELEALSSTGRPGKAPRETRVPWITGWPAVRRRHYRVQKGPVSWRLGLRTPWITTPGAEGKREL